MRLRLETPDRAPFWLIGNPALNERVGQSEVLTEGLQITRQQQVVPGAEFHAPLFFDRQNQKVTYTATVKWEFNDEWERMDFIASVAPANPDDSLHAWEGNVYLRVDKGTEYREWLCEGVIISLSSTEISGKVGLKLNYAVTFGGFGSADGGSSELVNLVAYFGGQAELVINGAELDALVAAEWEGYGAEIRLRNRDFDGSLVWQVQGSVLPYAPFDLPISGWFDDLAVDINDPATGWSCTAEVVDGSLIIRNGVFERGLQNYLYFSVTFYRLIEGVVTLDVTTPLEFMASAGLGDPVNLIATDGADFNLIALDE